jgi:thioesterase domain-containing protein
MADPIPSTIEASKVETLEHIWQRVFHRAQIGPEEDFFALGGDVWLAAELFSRIHQEFGQRLTPATLCNAPTIRTLAAALDNPQPIGPLVRLKEGHAQAAPIFIFHGVGSSSIDLVPLVRRLQSDQPIYGLETKGNDGREDPLDRVEDIAQFFLPAIRKILPHGPYLLIGYSFGGLVALEIAQRLKTESEGIGLLVMLDSYPDRRHLSFGQYSRLLLQVARTRLTGTNARKRQLPAAQDLERSSLVHALDRVKRAQYRALRNYRPRFYDGKVKFLRADLPSRFPADPAPVWSHLVGALEVETVPGEHLDMLTTSVDSVASILDHYVREACARHAG